MGDDVLDLPVLTRVGTVGGAGRRRGGRAIARALGPAPRGGDGAVRELIERVLRAQGHWDELLASYLPAAASEGERR